MGKREGAFYKDFKLSRKKLSRIWLKMGGNSIKLVNSTGVPQADDIIRMVISAIDAHLKNRVRGYYLTGSYADHTAAGSLSDIDLFIVLKDEFVSPKERDTTLKIALDSASAGSIRMDSSVSCESELSKLHPVIQVALKSSSLLMYGEDIREHILMPPIERYTRSVCAGAVYFIGPIFRNSENFTLPLGYPHPDEPFYGYDHKRILSWYPETVKTGTKELVACVSRIATSLVAIQTKQYTGSKSASLHLYRLFIADQWTNFLEILYENLRQRWHYQIPQEKDARSLVRQICEQTLGFENHFLEVYSNYLNNMSESHIHEDRQFAMEQLRRFVE